MPDVTILAVDVAAYPVEQREPMVAAGVVGSDGSLTIDAGTLHRILGFPERIDERPADPTNCGPRLDALLTDYDAALAVWRERGATVLVAADFIRRLELCRACPMGFWTESTEDGYGRCNDVRRACSKIPLWNARTRCGLNPPAW